MLKLAYFLRKIQTLRVNNSRILTIKNSKFLGYYFYMNLNIWGDFQICISGINIFQRQRQKRQLNNSIRIKLNTRFREAKRSSALPFYNNTVTTDADAATGAFTNGTANQVVRTIHRTYFLPRVKIKNYTVFTDGRNFYVKSINDLIKKKDQSRKIVTGQGSDYARRCLLDYSYFKDNYQLIAVVDLSTQKH